MTLLSDDNSLSKPVLSDQSGIHEGLIKKVERNLNASFLRPVPDRLKRTLEILKSFIESRKRPIILDSFCGTGMSSVLLSKYFPEYDVLGFDKSIVRLRKGFPDFSDEFFQVNDNCFIIREDYLDLWKGLYEWKIMPEKHFILYPNPWPKKKRLNNRFYASPVFKYLPFLGSDLTVRTNWTILLIELKEAISILGKYPFKRTEVKVEREFLTLFEKKYFLSGHLLYEAKVLF